MDIYEYHDPENAAYLLSKERHNWGRSQPDDSHLWALVYTSNRDSDLIERANDAALEKHMGDSFPNSPDWFLARGSHWAAGYLNQTAIRLWASESDRDNDIITPEFREFAALMAAIADNGVLDDVIYSNMQYDEAIEWIRVAGRLNWDPNDAEKIYEALVESDIEPHDATEDQIDEAAITARLACICPQCGEYEYLDPENEYFTYCDSVCWEESGQVTSMDLPMHHESRAYGSGPYQPFLLRA